MLLVRGTGVAHAFEQRVAGHADERRAPLRQRVEPQRQHRVGQHTRSGVLGGLTLAFVVGQALYAGRFVQEES